MVKSSVETKSWLELIKSGVAERIAELVYADSQFWATFKNCATNRNIAYLRPTKKQIWLHMHLPLSADMSLEATSASKQWAKTCPSLFRVKSKSDVEKAISLIFEAYEFDLKTK